MFHWPEKSRVKNFGHECMGSVKYLVVKLLTCIVVCCYYITHKYANALRPICRWIVGLVGPERSGSRQFPCRGTGTNELYESWRLNFCRRLQFKNLEAPPTCFTTFSPTLLLLSSKMCPHATAENANNEEMVAIDMSGTPNVNSTAPTNGTNGANSAPSSRLPRGFNPYAPRASDFLNNVSNFKIIESTLRGAFGAVVDVTS
jgi:hypothetical protein